MDKRRSYLLLPFIAVMLLSGCANKSDSATNEFATLNLTGSKQGQSVAFADADGDGRADKIVGAPYALTTDNRIGVVLVYKGYSTGYSTVPTSLFKGDDNLGYSLAGIGDADGDGIDDFAVGAIHGDGEDVSLSGSVTIYRGGCNGEVIKKLWGEWPMDKFGLSLTAGDLNGDGKQDLVVGAPFNTNDPALYQGGAVYVYLSTDGTQDFTNRTVLYASSTYKGLGWAAAAGDVNGDGIGDLLIGAAKKALVYYGGNTFAPDINAPDAVFTSAAKGFGKTLAVIGDIDGVAGGEIAIGAPNAVLTLGGVSSRDVGSVYVVSAEMPAAVNLDATTPPAELKARIDSETLFSRFGTSIAAVGDVDNGGKPDFAVGAPMRDVDWNTLSGMVYLFKGEDVAAGASWVHSSGFPGSVNDQLYGTSLAVKDGEMLIGAPGSDGYTGGVAMVDPATGELVTGGSSSGVTGSSGECH